MFLFNHLNLINLVREDIQTLYSWLSERTIDDLFSQWATYCEIFHTRKPMGLLSDGLNNVNVRYKKRSASKSEKGNNNNKGIVDSMIIFRNK